MSKITIRLSPSVENFSDAYINTGPVQLQAVTRQDLPFYNDLYGPDKNKQNENMRYYGDGSPWKLPVIEKTFNDKWYGRWINKDPLGGFIVRAVGERVGHYVIGYSKLGTEFKSHLQVGELFLKSYQGEKDSPSQVRNLSTQLMVNAYMSYLNENNLLKGRKGDPVTDIYSRMNNQDTGGQAALISAGMERVEHDGYENDKRGSWYHISLKDTIKIGKNIAFFRSSTPPESTDPQATKEVRSNTP
jgi:hypothetical protein